MAANNRNKWISLRLVGHTRLMEELKEKREQSRRRSGQDGSGTADTEAEKEQLLRALSTAWQKNLEVEIYYNYEGHDHRCQGRIELLRRRSPRVILKSGERLRLEDITAVRPADG